jgi:hypothetical protein
MAYQFEKTIDGLKYKINLERHTAVLTGHKYGIGPHVDIPSSITCDRNRYYVNQIGRGAFKGCQGVTSVTIPETVIAIKAEAFKDCSDLIRIVIPDSVHRIGYSAFANCKRLICVRCEISLPGWLNEWEGDIFLSPNYEDIFDGSNTDKCTLYVPEYLIKNYSCAMGFRKIKNILPIKMDKTIISKT